MFRWLGLLLFVLGTTPPLQGWGNTIDGYCPRELELRATLALAAQRMEQLKERANSQPGEAVRPPPKAESTSPAQPRLNDKARATWLEDSSLPRGIRFNVSVQRTFRHYIGSTQNLESILSVKALRSGVTSYVQVSPGVEKREFNELSGIFLTTPDFLPEQVGLPATTGSSMRYVDVELPGETPLIQLEPGIFLVPLPRTYPDWLVNTYRDFDAGKEIPQYLIATCEKIQKAGGLPETEARLPVKILGVGGE